MIQDIGSYYGRRIGTRMQSIKWCHFHVSPNIYSEVHISSSVGLIVCIRPKFKKNRHSSTAFDMCARCEDMISPLCEQTISTGAELAGTQNKRCNRGCSNAKSE